MLILISDAFDRSLPDKLSVFGEVTDDTTRLPEADVILVRSKTKCTKEYIDQAKKCRLIIRGGVGMDNIDRAYCEAKGIIAVNTPRSSAIAVAEMAFAFMLSTASRICFYDRTMKEGEWAKKTKRSELCGKTLTLLGYGNIPRQLAVRAKAFGMNVQAYDPYVKEAENATLIADLGEAVREADYISMHLPYTPDTDKLLDAALIAEMEKCPVIINTGRGKTVDEQAVADALNSGKIAWFCTDVYSTEPPVKGENPLLDCSNVTLSPHVGANSTENLLRIGQEVYDTIARLVEEGRIA